jgi:hypothetical protein
MSGDDIQDDSKMPGSHKIGHIAKMKKTSDSIAHIHG